MLINDMLLDVLDFSPDSWQAIGVLTSQRWGLRWRTFEPGCCAGCCPDCGGEVWQRCCAGCCPDCGGEVWQRCCAGCCAGLSRLRWRSLAKVLCRVLCKVLSRLGKHFFWTSLHFLWTWTLLLDLTTILLEMATLLLDLHTLLLDLILPSCSTWPFPKPYFFRIDSTVSVQPRLHRNFSDSRALELR